MYLENLVDDAVNVHGVAADAAGGVYSVLAEPELDQRGGGVAHGPVLHHLQVLQRVDEAALHVTRTGGSHGRVHQSLPAAHRVEEVLRGGHAGLVT